MLRYCCPKQAVRLVARVSLSFVARRIMHALRQRHLFRNGQPCRRIRLSFLSTTVQSALGRVASVYESIPDDLYQLVQDYSRRPQTPSSLQRLIQTGRGELLEDDDIESQPKVAQADHRRRVLIQSARFLRTELPIRLAHRILDLDAVPLMRHMPAVQRVKGIYVDSLLDILQVPATIVTVTEEALFARTLHALYDKHSSVLVEMARGAYELRQGLRRGEWQLDNDDDNDNGNDAPSFERWADCHNFLDRFYTSRIGIRVLAGQYLALRDPSPKPHHVGLICQSTSPSEIVQQAARDAAGMCTRQYGRTPPIRFEGNLDLTLAYIPTYLHYIALELLKNALRATAEAHQEAASLPPVTVVIADGYDNEDVVIKISDEGSGIRRSQMNKVWSYLYTTADPSVQESFVGSASSQTSLAVTDHGDQAPIAGLGYGLPIARSYCRYFGGDVDLISMQGYGTDAFVHLKRFGDAQEPLPDKTCGPSRHSSILGGEPLDASSSLGYHEAFH